MPATRLTGRTTTSPLSSSLVSPPTTGAPVTRVVEGAFQPSLTSAAERPSKMAVGYGRVSLVRQTNQILDQEASIRDFCAAEKLEFVEMYDEGLSSGTSDKRPVLVRLMQRIREGKSGIGYLVVHSYSRLARDAFELERQLQCLELCGVQLVSITVQLPHIALRADILSDSAEPPVLRS